MKERVIMLLLILVAAVTAVGLGADDAVVQGMLSLAKGY